MLILLKKPTCIHAYVWYGSAGLRACMALEMPVAGLLCVVFEVSRYVWFV